MLIELFGVTKRKNIRVINKIAVTEATLAAISSSTNSKEFLDNIRTIRRDEPGKVYKVLNQTQVERKLFLTPSKEKEAQTRVILSRCWEEIIEDNQKLRYLLHSKEAFQFLKRLLKKQKLI